MFLNVPSELLKKARLIILTKKLIYLFSINIINLDDNTKRIILKNFWEFYELANSAFKQKKFNGAVTLYYKALVELCDFSLVSKSGQLGVNHSERFRMLEKFNPELYQIADKLFRFYRDSYNKEISSAIATVVKENVERAKNLVLPPVKN